LLLIVLPQQALKTPLVSLHQLSIVNVALPDLFVSFLSCKANTLPKKRPPTLLLSVKIAQPARTLTSKDCFVCPSAKIAQWGDMG
jgi:hypothetical protein